MVIAANRAELRSIIVDAFASMTADEAIERLDEAQIANARVNDMRDVWNTPNCERVIAGRR